MNIFAFYKVLFHYSTLFYFFLFTQALTTSIWVIWSVTCWSWTEFCLCIFVQELLKNRRGDTSRAPWRQTTSTKNYRAERLWPEENARVNYPLKRALNFIKEQEIFNMEDPLVSFEVSWVTLHVSKVGSENFVNSWNYHRIPGVFWCFRRRPLNFYVGVIFSLNFINHDYVFIVTYLFFMWYFPFSDGFVMLFCKEY